MAPQSPAPERPLLSLSDYKRSAKRLKKAVHTGDPAAIERVRRHAALDRPPRHADCLHVIALEAGFASWPKLKFFLDLQTASDEDQAKRLEVALYHGQVYRIEQLLSHRPSLATANLGLALALYDRDFVARTLAEDPEAALRPVNGRTPLLHLAFSREHLRSPGKRPAMMALAGLLLEHGADVNDAEADPAAAPHRLSALYGALCHAENLALGRWLLQNGAAPDDNESLYHATEQDTVEALALLLAHGATIEGTNALPRALDFDRPEMIRLLLEHGADPNEAIAPHPSGETALEWRALHHGARRGCSAETARLLLDAGADPSLKAGGHSAYALARLYGNQAFAEELARHGAGTHLSESEEIIAAALWSPAGAAASQQTAHAGDHPQLTLEQRRLLIRLTAANAPVAICKRLPALGLDLSETDEMGLTALQTAAWHGYAGHLAWLLELSPDLSHRNFYGGDALDTALHGAQFCPEKPGRDPLACVGLLLKAGARPTAGMIKATADEDMEALLEDALLTSGASPLPS